MLKQLKKRLSGEKYTEAVDIMNRVYRCKYVLKIMKESLSIENPNAFWINWFSNVISVYNNDYIRALRINSIIPKPLLPKQIRSILDNTYMTACNYAINSTCTNNKIKLKKVTLSQPETELDTFTFINNILEIFTTYLLNDVDKNILYDFFDSVPFHQYFSGPYEYEKVKLSSNDIVIDAGANEGLFSALCSAKGCSAYAFEPIPQTITHLNATAKLNPNITICNYALSDFCGDINFNYDSILPVAATYVENSLGINKNNSELIKCKTITLDSFVDQCNLPKIDFIKADIEGAERDMLRGAKNVLKDFAPKLSICTYHLPDDPQVLRELILEANPNYIIEERWHKMYANVPNNKEM
ncbi:MAG: FkbM family methyltransferase [Oscillospiraceae bacterium]|jgi:FkbM family methyltransferase|nr:FkbM family methyltransferase [Oscillospiraceae bacterium]